MDWEVVGADALKALIPVVATVIFWAVRKVLPKVPRVALPIAAMLLGIALDALLAYVAGGTFSPLIGAALGASATWLREIGDTVKEHGLKA